MIKGKMISLAIAGIVGVGGVVIAKVDWSQRSALNNSSTTIANYVAQTNEAMSKSKNIIEQQNKEIEELKEENSNLNTKIGNLNNQLNQENEMIGSLNKVIATLQGSSNYKNMSVAEKKKTLNNLLTDWGYGKVSIAIADKIFSWTDGWGLYQVQNNVQNNTSNNDLNNKVDKA
ncbi:MAG: hypothetical protein ACRCWM_10735 [Sarcina sp.]